jgi:hypothetical protein
MFVVKEEHIYDGHLLYRELPCVPSKNDWIKIGKDNYVVRNVTWNFADRRTVILLVDNTKF